MQIFRGTFPFHSISPGWRYHKNNKELVVIKNHTIYKNNKITVLGEPLKENEELFKSADSFHQTELLIRYRELINNFLPKGWKNRITL